MPWHALVLELGAGFLAMIAFLLDVSVPGRELFSRSSGSSASVSAPSSDPLRPEKQEAVAEALTVLGLLEAPSTRSSLIVHNGLSASRRRY